MEIYLRKGDIVFSKGFLDVIKESGIIPTRKNFFRKDSLVINHGNSNLIKLGKNVKKFYIINKPELIKFCVNKYKNFELLKEFYPETNLSPIKVKKYPVMVKPLNGHHGYGIKKIDNYILLSKYLKQNTNTHLIQEFIPIKHEFRFNVFDREVFQVSHKERIMDGDVPAQTNKGGMVFSYRSLGDNARISDKFWDYINSVISSFHLKIGNDIGNYCIDVMKSTDNKYYLSEINSAYGIGQFTITKLNNLLLSKLKRGDLEKYRIR